MRGPIYSGRVLGGRYQVGELLGEGGWGAVYAAVQVDLGRRVALKILHMDVAITPDAVSRFEREAKAAAALGHPNIVQVTDFFPGSPQEPPFLVMELLGGATLGTLLKRYTVLPPNRVVSIAFQMLSALDVAHRAGLVHRDVKPDNVFLVSMPGIDDFVKLLDFGIAKLSAENVAQLTGDGQMLGSPAFMSPEQVRNLPLDPRSDLHAVAATMYFALAGRLPFASTNIATLLGGILEQRPAPLTSVVPGIDPRLSAIVERALEKDPHQRFASAADMRAALEPWVRATGVTPLATSLPPTAASPSPAAATFGATPAPSPHVPTWAGASTPGVGSGQPTPVAAPFGPGHPTPSASGGGAVIGLLVGIVVLLLVLGGGGFYWLVLRPRAAAEAAPVASAASSVAIAPTPTETASAAPNALPTASTTPKGGATRMAPGPAPAPVADAGSPKPTVVDAGAPARKAWGGTTVKFGGGAFGAYDIEKSKAEINRILPRLTACYVATELDPPDHQFTSWTVSFDPSGKVTKARRTTDFEPHPKLDVCVIAALRTMKWQALPAGGEARIDLTARTRDNP